MENKQPVPPSSRLIIKNVPSYYTEEKLKTHFSKQGSVTDVKIMRKNEKSRKFAYIGYSSIEEAQKAVQYFNSTYIDTSKIAVDYAYPQSSDRIPRPWSKYSEGSSAYNSRKSKQSDINKPSNISSEKEKRKADYKKFLKLAKSLKSTKQSWNDLFAQVMSENYVDDSKAHNKEEAKEPEVKKEDKEEIKNKEGDAENPATNVNDPNELDETRLFLMNLPFGITETTLKEEMEKYGNVEEIYVPFDVKLQKPRGIAFVKYLSVDSAIEAYASLDKTIFQGRILHIKPAQKRPPPKEKPVVEEIKQNNEPKDEPKISKYKMEKTKENKKNFANEKTWNYLFVNMNTALENITKRIKVEKKDLLSNDESNVAVNIASSEAQIINETKEWLKLNGINIGVFDGATRLTSKRSEKVLLIKNISYDVNEKDLRDLFELFGTLTRLLLAPSNVIGIVEYENPNMAKAALKKIQGKRLKGFPLYLEYAPENMKLQEIKEMQTKKAENKGESGPCVFISNLNFETKEDKLRFVFNEVKAGKIISVRIVKNEALQSKGYGFIEYSSADEAKRAIDLLQGIIIDEHALKLSFSLKKVTNTNDKLQQKRAKMNLYDDPTNEKCCSTKLLIKNLAFEATKKDLVKLFEQYGTIKTVRLPRKADNKHRGFAFVEYTMKEQAKTAFISLQSTHLYGRKLVIQWAKVDNEESGIVKTNTQKRRQPDS